MRPKLLWIAACLVLLCSLPLHAAATTEEIDLLDDNGFLGIYADAAGTQRCAAIPQGSFGVLYLFAELAGAVSTGITGVEFRIQVTNPTGYQFFYTPPSEPSLMLGNPFDLTPNDPHDQTGANVAFTRCQTGPRVPMGTVAVVNLSGGPTELRVERRNLPSNSQTPCPLFVDCNPPKALPDGQPSILFSTYCMRTCASNETGGSIAFRMSLNDPSCAPAEFCPTACLEAPCVTLSSSAPTSECPGSPMTLGATAVNCSSVPEDVDLYIDQVLAGSFVDVQPGQSVSATRTVPLQGCSARFVFGALARTTACPEPVGAENSRDVICIPGCSDNRSPDCRAARPSVATLWPPNGELVPVEILGVTDPDGDPLRFEFVDVFSDEPTGTVGKRDCPDAVLDADGKLLLRAERSAQGDGRVYHVVYQASDGRGGLCGGFTAVCVPLRSGETCLPGLEANDAFGGCAVHAQPRDMLTVTPRSDAGAEIQLVLEESADVRLEIYDVRGRKITTMRPGLLPAGDHRLRWNGRDEAGSAVASGIYVFRMLSSAGEAVTKGVVVR